MIRKHSATLHGHRTSFSLEDEFWDELKRIAGQRNLSIAGLIAEVDDDRASDSNLSSALRVYVLRWLKGQQSQAENAV
ncbi:putative DNA-binding ribbon-helix-helix protein [Pseudorhizobium tarimense]|uniref:DNA-binding ribbon-helix-helix protein n=1 Tax=Pseudorhizobium tarimense TaxID=1079109 RepID=A0ABV2H3T0_9HYPH|nr:ribbon-helix-helix domain-containing protein [Pseudorhizobium tarimense]MCJ8518376.1 ribbon-helix-helix domain-containing protein [Pseudorhizobium tarimense]